MLVRSCSESNLLSEKTINKHYKLKLMPVQKLISYGEFIRNNPTATKMQRREAIKIFYDKLLHC